MKSKAVVLTMLMLCGSMAWMYSRAGAHTSKTVGGDLLVPENLRPIITRACRDCHTDQTQWPWYSRLPVVSFVIERDVRKGKEHLNFSKWGIIAKGKPTRNQLQEVCDAVADNAMPPRSYRFVHPESRLTDRDVDALCQWADIASNLSTTPAQSNP